jgi:hypothetical protein
MVSWEGRVGVYTPLKSYNIQNNYGFMKISWEGRVGVYVAGIYTL